MSEYTFYSGQCPLFFIARVCHPLTREEREKDIIYLVSSDQHIGLTCIKEGERGLFVVVFCVISIIFMLFLVFFLLTLGYLWIGD
jgi:hypothetical protein